MERRTALDARIAAIVAPRRPRRIVASLPFFTVAAITLVTVAWTPRPRALLHAAAIATPARDTTIPTPHAVTAPTVVAAQPKTPRSLPLVQSATAPEPLPASPEDSMLAAVGYVARKQAGRGVFIDGQVIDHQAARFSELLRSAPGFRVIDGCVNTFIDGMPWASMTPGDVDEFVRPAEVLALEGYHRSDVPPQFLGRDTRECATIVAWTRARMTRR